MGTLDKAMMLIVAVIFIIVYFTNDISGISGIVLLILAIVFALTHFLRFCPLYQPFGMNTDKSKAEYTFSLLDKTLFDF